ncbi:MAG: lamin tail domain-containing protein [Roseofilum sp. Belize BBD 4]|uniref:lamin tail domain-containing protein n=1 Tax=Roseofilum sp. Belize BBD 4 TaxID=2821500 RepID=UPI001B26B750|nr:lamin tail domain-containing protein [Roseofilum sp. Belize BBD 4]MBP0031743.1 lamin tail domain-containing protein [Roseofilum sp. Belize BBD 4]
MEVVLSKILYKGEIKGSQSDEYIEIANYGEGSADLSGWKVASSGTNQEFIFPEGTALASGKKCRVYTNQINQESGGFSFEHKTALWNDLGSTGKLFDAQGNEVSSISYSSNGKVAIAEIGYKGQIKGSQSDEYIAIANHSDKSVDLSGWKVLSSGRNKEFIFPESTSLASGQTIRVYTDQINQESGGFSFEYNSALWNDQGGTGKLFDAQGNEVSSYSYQNSN